MSAKMTVCPRPALLVVVDEGVLPDELVFAIREHLKSCALCRQLQADLRDPPLAEPTLEDLARLRKRVLVQPSNGTSLWRYGAVAAALVLAAGGYFLTRTSVVAPPAPAPVISQQGAAPPPVYRLKLDPAPLRLPFAAALVLRGKEADGDQKYLAELGVALKPYREGQFAPAATALATLGSKYPKAVEPAFYEGISRLLSRDAAGAIAPLEHARKIGGEALNDDILWYLAVAYERIGKWDDAAMLLQSLCRMEGTYHTAACAGIEAK